MSLFDTFDEEAVKAALTLAAQTTSNPGVTEESLSDFIDWASSDSGRAWLEELRSDWGVVDPGDDDDVIYKPRFPNKVIVPRAGEEMLWGNRVSMYYLSGKPRDYGSHVDIVFSADKISYIEETRDMQDYQKRGPWVRGTKWRPEEGSVGTKIFAPPWYVKDELTLYHN